MPSPFPGMDPYLESPDWFPCLHDGLIYLYSGIVAAATAGSVLRSDHADESSLMPRGDISSRMRKFLVVETQANRSGAGNRRCRAGRS